MVKNRDHKNVAYMFSEKKRLNPENDTLTIWRGDLGSYPNFAFDVHVDELGEFVDTLQKTSSEEELEVVVSRFGVRRSDPDFWLTMDWFVSEFYSQDPTAAGLFDLGRYENR